MLHRNTWYHITVQTNDYYHQLKKWGLKNDYHGMLKIWIVMIAVKHLQMNQILALDNL